VWITSWHPLGARDGGILGINVVAEEITERKRAEAALIASETKFHELADNMSQLAWTADALGRIYWYNKRWHDYTGTTLEAADIATILKALPHRYPFLMVDRVINIRGDESGIGIKNVTANEPQFLGHFPGNPVFPGVLLIEGMAQTAGAICILSKNLVGKPQLVYFMTIDKAKFRKPVIPGDTIEYHVTKISQRRTMWWFRGEAKVAGELVAEAEVGAMTRDA